MNMTTNLDEPEIQPDQICLTGLEKLSIDLLRSMVLSPVFVVVPVFVVYTFFSAETVFSHKSPSLLAYVIHIVQEKYLKNVSHLTVNYFQIYLFQFTRCDKIMRH